MTQPIDTAGDQAARDDVVHLPAPLRILRSSFGHLMESTLLPLGVFYAVLTGAGLRWGLTAALVWCYASIVRRVVTRQRVPGLLILGAGLFTVRTAVAMAAGSVFIYFLQPTLGTFLVAGLFLVSARFGRPLAERLAHDFCPLPDRLIGNSRIHHFFLQISLLWALVYLVNGAATLALLLTSSLGTFLVFRTVASTALTVVAVGASFLLFRRSVASEGLVLRWARHGS